MSEEPKTTDGATDDNVPAPPHVQTYTVRPGVTAVVEQAPKQTPIVTDEQRKAAAKAAKAAAEAKAAKPRVDHTKK